MSAPSSPPSGRLLALVLACGPLLGSLVGCPDPTTGGTVKAGPRNELANKWLKRAGEEYAALDLTEAKDSIEKASKNAPGDKDIGILGAKIHLARLDFKAAVKALEGIEGSEAAGLRARAYWYDDDLAHASEELTRALEDPDFKDPWAKPVRELAGTQGAGRKPFQLKDTSARLVELRMPRDLFPAMMVPIEVDGQTTVALVVTGVPEVVLDQKTRSKPSWVSIRIANDKNTASMEFRDVPALVEDLSGYSQQQVPIGALIGANFLRRLHATFDRGADQLVLRRDDPPNPPTLTRLPVAWVRGGGMVVRATIKKEFELSGGLWIDSGSPWGLAFPEPTWKTVGVDVSKMQTYNDTKYERLTNIKLGALDLGPAVGVSGATAIEDKLKQLDVTTIGALGMTFLGAMRVSLVENGRTMWIETDQDTSGILAPNLNVKPPPKPAGSAKPAGSGSAKPPAASASASAKPPAPPASAKPAAPPASAKPAPTPSAKASAK
ncbi:MAG: hypothetical protein JNL79_22210 [Myxococcales bacterium]|nr:hypothetical protein [Myxococcales bacterium]